LWRCCAGTGWRLLRRHRVALVFADSVAWPYAEDLTADFVYLRLHGSEELYASGYSDEALDHSAARIKLWVRGLEPKDARLIAPDVHMPRRKVRDVYVYFDNDAKVRARSTPARCAPRWHTTPSLFLLFYQDKIRTAGRAIAPLSSLSGPQTRHGRT
jgi:hypothetical protein